MRILDILKESSILVGLKSETKKAVLEEMVGVLAEPGAVSDKQKMLEVLLARESLGSTGIGQGIAIPHGKTDRVKELVAVLGISRKGVNFEALDGELVYIFFLLVAPKDTAGPHLKALAQISRLLRDSYFCELMKRCQSPDELYELIRREEEKKH